MILKNDNGEDVNLVDLAVTEVAEIIDALYENYHKSKDRVLRKELKQKYADLVVYYNKRVNFKCFSDTLK